MLEVMNILKPYGNLETADRKKGTREGNPIARIEDAVASFHELENIAREQLAEELGRPVAPKDPRVSTRAVAMRMIERAKEGREAWDTQRRYLVEAAKLRGLPCEGTKAELRAQVGPPYT